MSRPGSHDLFELRLDWGFNARRELVLDAALIHCAARDGTSVAVNRQTLCMAVVAWEGPSPQERGFTTAARAWLFGEPQQEGTAPPALLSESESITSWQRLLQRRLKPHLGPEVAELLDPGSVAADAPRKVRIVVRPHDAAAARLPVETLCWNREHLSVVRLPMAFSGAPIKPPLELGPQQDGRLTVGLVRTYAAAEEKPAGMQAKLERLTQATQGSLAVHVDLGRHVGTPDVATQRDRLAGSDVVVVAGHGTDVGGLQLADGTSVTAEAVAEMVQSGAAVLLAVCGSAAAPASGTTAVVSLAETLAARGAALVLGFQNDVDKEHARELTAVVVSALAERGAAGGRDGRLGLTDWEAALAAAREARGLDTATRVVAPVLYAHPALLAGETAELVRVRATELGHRGEATAICWCTPGQVTCFDDNGRQWRLPLAVDVGVDLQVILGEPRELPSVSTAVLSEDDVRTLAVAFELPSADHVRLVLTGVIEQSDWAVRTAVLSAAIRALASLGPWRNHSAHQLLHDVARQEWGALDGVPRILDVQTGRRSNVELGDGWPDVEVTPIYDAPMLHKAGPPARLPPATLATSRPAWPMTAEQLCEEALQQQKRFGRGGDRSWVPKVTSGTKGLLVPSRARLAPIAATDGRGPRLAWAPARTSRLAASDDVYTSSTS